MAADRGRAVTAQELQQAKRDLEAIRLAERSGESIGAVVLRIILQARWPSDRWWEGGRREGRA